MLTCDKRFFPDFKEHSIFFYLRIELNPLQLLCLWAKTFFEWFWFHLWDCQKESDRSGLTCPVSRDVIVIMLMVRSSGGATARKNNPKKRAKEVYHASTAGDPSVTAPLHSQKLPGDDLYSDTVSTPYICHFQSYHKRVIFHGNYFNTLLFCWIILQSS